eukprot:TRINITY_DN27593_c0_g3_i1.p3 TRINITY_DN27593_c0_g3~~TRINITY_DN27593_c0_g3_i1.p3  ORF type:complete len:103 (+),score=5.20 TRINITY_DN27593_c0_g3_i1:203-511(+)
MICEYSHKVEEIIQNKSHTKFMQNPNKYHRKILRIYDSVPPYPPNKVKSFFFDDKIDSLRKSEKKKTKILHLREFQMPLWYTHFDKVVHVIVMLIQQYKKKI